MLRILIVILLWGIFFPTPSGAQIKPRWDTIFFTGENAPELLVLDSGYVSMVQHNDSVNRLQIRELDWQGKLQKDVRHDFDAQIENCGNCLNRVNFNRFIYAHTLFYQIDSASIQLIKFNRKWDTVKTFNYLFHDSVGSQTYGFLIVQNKLLVTGYNFYSSQNRYEMILVCFDTNLVLQWEKSYAHTGNATGLWGFDIEPTGDGGYLLGGLSTTFPQPNVVNKGMLLKTDSLGNEEWRKTLPYPANRNGSALRLSKRSDGHFMFAGQQDVPGDLQRLRFGTVDVNGNILTDTLIGPAIDGFGAEPIVKTPDGNYIIGGTTQQGHWRGMLYKFSENGDEIWHRYYHRGDKADASSLYTYKVTPDSGLIMAGTYYDIFNNPTNQAIFHWLKKVDQHGCAVAGCHDIGKAEYPWAGPEVEVYPNPSGGKFFLQLPGNSLLAREDIYLHDRAGKQLEPELQELGKGLYTLDLTPFAKGTYLLHFGEEWQGHPVLKLMKD